VCISIGSVEFVQKVFSCLWGEKNNIYKIFEGVFVKYPTQRVHTNKKSLKTSARQNNTGGSDSSENTRLKVLLKDKQQGFKIFNSTSQRRQKHRQRM